jgi:hypothetical protein
MMQRKFRSMFGPSKEFVLQQQQATRTLLKFCEDHNHVQTSIVRDCLHALEEEEMSEAIAKFQCLNFGPYGFDDWFPPPVVPYENGEYAWQVFKALVEVWHRLMSLSTSK